MDFGTWWKGWSELVYKLVPLAGSVASLIALLVIFLPSPGELPWWAIILLVVAVVFFLLLVILEFIFHKGRQVYAKTDTHGIKSYMHNWIEHGGRVAIWTRDMSWADDTETQAHLMKKAQRNELILCLPEKNPLANELESAGAEICAYGPNLLESPASRFTIIFFGRGSARVAVGRAEGDTHVIDEFDSASHPAYYLAEDLITLVRKLCADRRSE